MAINFFSLAANQDHQEAQYQLGIIYYDNKINNDLSIYYLLLAAKFGLVMTINESDYNNGIFFSLRKIFNLLLL